MLVGPLKELVTGAPAPVQSLAGLLEQVRILCTVYDPRVGQVPAQLRPVHRDLRRAVGARRDRVVPGARVAPAAYTEGIVSPVPDSPAARAPCGPAPDAAVAPFRPAARQRVELVCPAGTPPALKAAVDNGADDVYLGFKDETNARNFAGLNFDDRSLREGIDYAHRKGAKVLVALNTYPQPGAGASGRRR